MDDTLGSWCRAYKFLVVYGPKRKKKLKVFAYIQGSCIAHIATFKALVSEFIL